MMSVQSLAVLGFVAAAQAGYAGYYANTTSSEAIVYTTVTTDVYTTFCPEATTFTQGTKTYTATKSETLTITDCPCTYSHPVYTPKPTASSSYVAPPPSYNTTDVPVWYTTTETVKTYTTYCPAPTTIVQGNHTYTATEATTLTITAPHVETKTYPGSIVTVTIGSTTTYCPVPTTITTAGSTYPVTAPGTVTIPIYTTSVVPVPSYPASTPKVSASSPEASAPTYPATTPVAPYPSASTVATSGYPSSGTGVAPSPSGPTQVTTSGAAAQQLGFSAMVAALVAMVL